VIVSAALQLPYVKKSRTQARRINIERLQTDATHGLVYSLKLQNKFKALDTLTDMDTPGQWWPLLEVASSTIGLKISIRQPWMTDSTFNVLEKKAVARGRRFGSTGGFRGYSIHRLSWAARRTITDCKMRHRKESIRTICAPSRALAAGEVRQNQLQSRKLMDLLAERLRRFSSNGMSTSRPS